MTGPRRGFTLVELMIALTVAGLAVTVALQVFGALSETSRRTSNLRQEFAREMNAWQWLSAAVASMDAGPDSVTSFEGEPSRMRFRAWLVTGDGWFERVIVEVGSTPEGLVARYGGRTVVLAGGAQAQLDYLVDLGADALWLRRWRSRVAAPRAIRVRVMPPGAAADTLIFAVGERG